MPIPKPNDGESETEFIDRCMADPVMVEDYGDESQRAAVCFQQWREGNKTMPSTKNGDLPDVKSKKELEKENELNFQAKEFKLIDFEVKEVTDEGEFSGYLAVYNNVDQGYDSIERGAFSKTLKDNKGQVPLFWQHREPIGKLTLTDKEKGLWAEGKFTRGVQQAEEAYKLLKDGVAQGLSIGFLTIKSKVIEGVRYLKELRLMEGSLVVHPMNRRALVSAVKTEDYELDYLDVVLGFQIAAAELKKLADSGQELPPHAQWTIKGVLSHLAELLKSEAADTDKEAADTPDGAADTSESAVDTSQEQYEANLEALQKLCSELRN